MSPRKRWSEEGKSQGAAGRREERSWAERPAHAKALQQEDRSGVGERRSVRPEHREQDREKDKMSWTGGSG